MNQRKNFPKVVNPTNKKTYYKSMGTSVINSPLSHELDVIKETGNYLMQVTIYLENLLGRLNQNL